MPALAAFPPEILSIISSSLNGFDIAHLWLCGDGMLMAHLEVGVAHFSLSLAQTINCCWPNLISHFRRLESLIIRPRSENHRIWFRDVDFYGISSTLKHLELEFDNLEFSLFGLPFVVPDAYPDPIWSPPTEGEMILSPFPMATHFPRLETIRFGGDMNFPSILVPMLPPGLLSLSLPYEAMDSSLMKSLPTGMTHLELINCLEIDIQQNELIFPSSLTHLDLHFLSIPSVIPPIPLPSSLTYLAAAADSFDFSTFQLPPTLTSLAVSKCFPLDPKIFACIPRTLLHLNIQTEILASQLKTLPSGLQTLHATRIADLSDTLLIQLPCLTHLSLKSAALSSETIFSLPTSLRHLAMHGPFLDNGTPYPFMPNLEYLSATVVDPSALVCAPKLATLPILDFSSQSAVPLIHLTSLTSLSIMRNISLGPETLHPSLIDLAHYTFDSPLSSQYLPRGLNKLTISLRSDVSEEAIAHLPPDLTELNLLNRHAKKSISNASIALLPRSLEVFLLQSAINIGDDGISMLPPNLRVLRLTNVPLLTDSSASLFPRRLTVIQLNEAPHLSNQCVKYLPRSLTSLGVFGDSKLTRECFTDLPPCLTSFSLPKWDTSFSSSAKFLIDLME